MYHECVNAISPYYYIPANQMLGECMTLVNGGSTISLVQLFPQMVDLVTGFVENFKSSPRDSEGIKALYVQFVTTLCNPIDLTITLLLLAYTVTVEDFNQLLITLSKEGTNYLVGAIVSSLDV